MSAPTLSLLFDTIYLISLTAWVGGLLFYWLGVAPLLSQVLEPATAARFGEALLPRVYQWGAIAGAIALPSAVAVPLAFPELRGPGVGVQAMVILASILLMLHAGNVLAPALIAARGEGAAGLGRCRRLRRRWTAVNGLVLGCGLALLVSFAARPRPSTQGIVELTPTQRAEAIGRRLRDLGAKPVPRHAP